MTEATVSPRNPGTPGAPQPTFSGASNEPCHDTPISTGTREPTNTNTNIITALHKHNTNTHAILEEKREYAPGSSSGNAGLLSKKIRVNVYLSEVPYRQFQKFIRSLGYSVSEFFNQIVISSVQSDAFAPRPQININLAVAKAESKPVINVGEYVALKQLDELLQGARKLKDRAERESQEGKLLTFTVERARKLEEEIFKAMRNFRRLQPEKLQEIDAALSILKGIREGRA